MHLLVCVPFWKSVFSVHCVGLGDRIQVTVFCSKCCCHLTGSEVDTFKVCFSEVVFFGGWCLALGGVTVSHYVAKGGLNLCSGTSPASASCAAGLQVSSRSEQQVAGFCSSCDMHSPSELYPNL